MTIKADDIDEDAYTRWLKYLASWEPVTFFLHNIQHNGIAIVKGIAYNTGRSMYNYYDTVDLWVTSDRCVCRSDVMNAFCDRQGDWECPYIKHIAGDRINPPEDYCPADFNPSYTDCPYHDGFVEEVIEALEEMNVEDVDEEEWD